MSALLRRLRRVGNRLDLRLAEQLPQHVGQHVVEVLGSDAENLGMHLQPVTQLLRIHIPVSGTRSPAVLEQGGDRTIRIQRLSNGTPGSPTRIPNTGSTSAGRLDKPDLTKTLERLDSTRKTFGDRKPNDLRSTRAVLLRGQVAGIDGSRRQKDDNTLLGLHPNLPDPDEFHSARFTVNTVTKTPESRPQGIWGR